LTVVNRRTVLGVALAATVVIGACSAATVPSAATPSQAPAAVAPSVVPPSQAPTVAAPSVAPQSLAPAAVSGPQTIHVLEDPINFHTVAAKGCTSAAGCKGDQLIGTSRMLDADTRVEVGSLAVTCILVDPIKSLYHCPANAISLTGRGQIVFDETVYIGGPWYPKPWPIISGSGEFLGATGSVISPKDGTWQYGDFVVTLTK
jgi:hypothetical protein